MKIVILGGEGMLGHKMVQTLQKLFPRVYCTIRGALEHPFYSQTKIFKNGCTVEYFEALDFLRLHQTLLQIEPHFIINCMGIIKQRSDSKAAVPSITINSLLPHKLAEWASNWGGRVIHFSTDCVFSGTTGGYTEESKSDAEDLYGKSKFLGEVKVENALTLRTSIIGRELADFCSLLEWFLAQKGKRIHGYQRVIYSGVTTNYICQVVARIIQEHPTLNGLYQLTSTPISKLDLLYLLKGAYQIPVEIMPDSSEVSDRTMIGEKFFRETGILTPPWPALVNELAADPTPYESWRIICAT